MLPVLFATETSYTIQENNYNYKKFILPRQNYLFAGENLEKPILRRHFFFLPAQINILPMFLGRHFLAEAKKILITRVALEGCFYFIRKVELRISLSCNPFPFFDLLFYPISQKPLK